MSSSAVPIAAGATAEHMMSSTQVMPMIFFCTVVNGMMTMSSWSWPVGRYPLDASTPVTRHASLLEPDGLTHRVSSPNSWVATVRPSTHTLEAMRHVLVARIRSPPDGQARIGR